jgi:hypothetical protein
MRKSTLKLVLLGLFTGIGAEAQSQISVATVTNHGNEQVVLLYTDDRAVSLEPGKSWRVAAGDVVSTLAGGAAAVRYQDGCTLFLSGNQRLPINSSDQTIGCAQREALIQRIEVYAAIGAPPETAVGSSSQGTSTATAVATNPCRPGFRSNDGRPAAGKAANTAASASPSNETTAPYAATGATSNSLADSTDDPTAAGPTAVAPTGGCTPAFITDNAGTGSLLGGAALLTAGIALSNDDDNDDGDTVISPDVP